MRRRLVGGYITHVCCVFPPYGGGMGKVCHDMAVQAHQKGFPIHVLAPLYPGRGEKVVSFVEFVKPLLWFGNAAVVPGLVSKLKDAAIIHLHYPFLGAECFILCRWFLDILTFKKRRHILHYHMDLMGSSWFRRIVYGLFQKLFLGWLCRWADVIVVTSLDYAREGQFKTYFQRYEKKIKEIPNGVDTQVFVPGIRQESFVASFGVLPHEHVLLFVGGMDTAHAFKGIPVLLKACARLPSEVLARLKVICVGTGDLQETYQKMASLYGLLDRVVFVGSQPLKSLISWYQSCEAVVLPSTNASEAFGVVLIEGAACGKPGIASDLPGVRSVISHEHTGFLCEVGDEKALSFAMQHVIDSPQKMTQMGQEALIRVQQKYAWKVVMNSWYQLYGSL